MKLKDKVVIITGGASGIGRAAVELFCTEGATVIACDMNEKALEELGELSHTGCGRVIPRTVNVTDRDAVEGLVAGLKSELGHIDGLVNNAGITRDALLKNMTEDAWDTVLEVNLKGVFNMTQAVHKVMLDQGTGSIVNTSSIVGVFGNIGQTNYSATKGGIIAMTKTWAKEFVRKGAKIRVNAVAPGFVKTPMTDAVPEKVIQAMGSKIPLGRMGYPEEIARVYLFLISDDSSYITGQVIGVDGGLVI